MGDDELYFVDLNYVESNKEEKSTYYLEFTKESYYDIKQEPLIDRGKFIIRLI